MDDDKKLQNRYNRIKQLKQFYEFHQTTTKFFKFLSFGIIGFAWILTLFFGFTLPFFFLNTIGAILWLYYHILTNNNLMTWHDYFVDPMVWFLSIIIIISGLYVLIASSRCSLNMYF